MSRGRDTPSAIRTAISRRRLSARASNRLATFAQAINRTISVTPTRRVEIATSGAGLMEGASDSRIGPANMTAPLSRTAFTGRPRRTSTRVRRTIVVAALLSHASLVPGAMRPTTLRYVPEKKLEYQAPSFGPGCAASGIHTSVALRSGPSKPAGAMPMIIVCCRLISTVLPTTPGSPPKARRQRRSLIAAT